MSGTIRAAFEFEAVTVRLDKLLPTRPVDKGLRQTAPYKTILASVREVGLIEPLSVSRLPNGKYLLLDGHVRLEVLRELGQEEVLCLVSTADEGYTYNAQVNRIAPIQANRMILKAGRDALRISRGGLDGLRVARPEALPEAWQSVA